MNYMLGWPFSKGLTTVCVDDDIEKRVWGYREKDPYKTIDENIN